MCEELMRFVNESQTLVNFIGGSTVRTAHQWHEILEVAVPRARDQINAVLEAPYDRGTSIGATSSSMRPGGSTARSFALTARRQRHSRRHADPARATHERARRGRPRGDAARERSLIWSADTSRADRSDRVWAVAPVAAQPVTPRGPPRSPPRTRLTAVLRTRDLNLRIDEVDAITALIARRRNGAYAAVDCGAGVALKS